ncbi:MAG: hypothetical protein ACKVQV_03660 [Bacteroidia bacterium]
MINVEFRNQINKAIKYINGLVFLSLFIAFLSAGIILPTVYSSVNQIPLTSVSTVLLPFMVIALCIEVVLIINSILLAQTGLISYPKRYAIGGCFILVLSIWFDVFTTIIVNPDLNREGNPFIMMAKAFSAPLWTMYLLGFFAQLGITIISCALWISYLRHYRIYLRTIWNAKPRNLFEFIWVGFGGNLKPQKLDTQIEKIPRSYRFVWVLVICMIAPFPRWVYGLEWLGVPIRVKLIPYIGNGIFLLEYFIAALVGISFIIWLSFHYLNYRKIELIQN